MCPPIYDVIFVAAHTCIGQLLQLDHHWSLGLWCHWLLHPCIYFTVQLFTLVTVKVSRGLIISNTPKISPMRICYHLPVHFHYFI